MFPPTPETGLTAAGRYAAGRFFRLCDGWSNSKGDRRCLTSRLISLTSTTRSPLQRESLRELIEQAAAYSGAADDDLVAQRLSGHEAGIELKSERREEVLQSTNSDTRRRDMTKSRIKKNMEVIGADGVHIGTVDRIIAGRIRLTKNDSGEGRHKGHHHYIDLGLVADVEDQTVRLSAVAATAVTFEEEKSGEPT